MARSTSRKRVKPVTYEPGSGGGSAKKQKTPVAAAAPTDVEPEPVDKPTDAHDAKSGHDDAAAVDGAGETVAPVPPVESAKAADVPDPEPASVHSSPKKAALKRSKLATNGRATNAKAAKASKAAKGSQSKAATKPKAAAKPRRKARSQEDKERENAPLAAPFFEETGSEWNNTDIDFDELSALRRLWELPAACHLLWLLQGPLSLRVSHTLLEYEAALLKPEESPVLEDVFTKLLLKKSERGCLSAGIGLKYEWWNKQLRLYYTDMYDKWYALLRKAGERLPASFSQDEDDSESSGEDDSSERQLGPVDVELSDDEWLTLDILKARLETLGMVCPLKHLSFADLSVELRCKILLNLCEAVVDDPANTEHLRQMEEDDLRVEPLGNDRAGNVFYFFPQFYEERRLYRLEAATQQWALWVKGDAAFRQMLAAMKAVRGRKVRGEQELLDHLEVIVEQLDDEDAARARQTDKANRLAVLEAIPRKRSLRLQVKHLEQLEKHQEEAQHKQQLTMEELADQRRAELLRKVEREAEREARDAEREQRRLQREQQEHEAQLAEREQRRRRRLDKEQQDAERELQLEAQRKKQEEARERRARQRRALEQAAQGAMAASTAEAAPEEAAAQTQS